MNKPLIAIGILLAIGLAATGAFAFGFHGGFGHQGNSTAIQNAIAANDYSAYLNATGNSTHVLNQTQFDALVAKYQQNAPERDARQRARTAITDNDYSAWKTAMTDLFNLRTTNAKFDRLVQHQKDGNGKDGAQGDNGHNFGMAHGKHGHGGFGSHWGAGNNSANITG